MPELSNITIEGTPKTPKIEFNQLAGDLVLSGRSVPENAARVYEPLLTWIETYIKSPCQTTNLHLNLEYYNSASTVWFAKLIRTLGKIKKSNCILFIHLYFDLSDFNDLDVDELHDLVYTLVGNIGDSKVSTGLKTYGTDRTGQVVKQSTIFI